MQRNQRVVRESPAELREVELLTGTGFESENPETEFEPAQDESEPKEAA